MSKTTTSTVSVVIPCFDEEQVIGSCLEALSRQTKKPLEVLLIDNNCTDSTAAIARRYGVKVIPEPRQGLIYARNKGYEAARGDILARIDADTVVAPEWVEVIQRIFMDPKVIAATGTGDFYDLPFKAFNRNIRNVFAVNLNRYFLGHHMLWGSNMAVRSWAWKELASELCVRSDIMEDLDIAMHTADMYGIESIVFDSRMIADLSARRAMASLARNFLYMKMWPSTLRLHRGLKTHFLWPVAGFLAVANTAYVGNLTRFYDSGQQDWKRNPRQWFNKTNYGRDNP